jgi:hypothetical protein
MNTNRSQNKQFDGTANTPPVNSTLAVSRENDMTRKRTIPFIVCSACFVLLFDAAGSTRSPLSHSAKSVPSTERAILERILRPLVPRDYSLEIRKKEHDPYRWRSPGEFSGVTFYFKGDESWTKREAKRRPCIYLTFMPDAYNGIALSPSEDAPKGSVRVFPSRYLGKWRKLQVYACRDFGYRLPEQGNFSEQNLRKAIGVVWDETRCIAPATAREIEKAVAGILPEGYAVEVRRDHRDPYHWASSGTSLGVTFYLRVKEKPISSDVKELPCTILTFMPPAYSGKPLLPRVSHGTWHVGNRTSEPEKRVEILPAAYLGCWRTLRIYACVNWGHPLPRQGVLGEKSIRGAFDMTSHQEGSQQQGGGDADKPRASP